MLSITYSVYIILVMVITVLIANTLSKNGEVFLIDGFQGNVALAKSINHMLVVGFYLVNLGFALLQMESNRSITSIDESLAFLSAKIGFVLLVLGAVHFFNLWVINKFKNNQLARHDADRLYEKELHEVEMEANLRV